MTTLLIAGAVLLGFPVLVYLSVKMGTWAYLQTKYRFEQESKETNNADEA